MASAVSALASVAALALVVVLGIACGVLVEAAAGALVLDVVPAALDAGADDPVSAPAAAFSGAGGASWAAVTSTRAGSCDCST